MHVTVQHHSRNLYFSALSERCIKVSDFSDFYTDRQSSCLHKYTNITNIDNDCILRYISFFTIYINLQNLRILKNVLQQMLR